MNWSKRHKLNPSNELEVKSNSQTNLFDLNLVMNWSKNRISPNSQTNNSDSCNESFKKTG